MMEHGPLHIYKRHKYQSTGTLIFKCIKPGCPHFIHPSILKGRRAECPRCHKEYILKSPDKRWALPCCSSCRSKSSTGEASLEQVKDKLMEDLIK